MAETWDEARLQQYITDGIEESLNLDYIAAASLDKTDKKKFEITKDVSAMANSDGGFIIYGISEDKVRSHLPEKLDPVDRIAISKEWLEQVISNIRPKIDGLKIYPVSLSSGANDVAYVVEIPQSHTAHQATDKRYYKRFNFLSEAMEDYEVRLVMNRGQHPKIEPKFSFIVVGVPTPNIDEHGNEYEIEKEYAYFNVRAYNTGSIYARYVNAYFHMPNYVLQLPNQEIDELADWHDYQKLGLDKGYKTFYKENIEPDSSGSRNQIPKTYMPILPKRWYQWGILIRLDFQTINLQDLSVQWEIYADNAPKLSGEIALHELEISTGHYENFYHYLE